MHRDVRARTPFRFRACGRKPEPSNHAASSSPGETTPGVPTTSARLSGAGAIETKARRLCCRNRTTPEYTTKYTRLREAVLRRTDKHRHPTKLHTQVQDDRKGLRKWAVARRGERQPTQTSSFMPHTLSTSTRLLSPCTVERGRATASRDGATLARRYAARLARQQRGKGCGHFASLCCAARTRAHRRDAGSPAVRFSWPRSIRDPSVFGTHAVFRGRSAILEAVELCRV